MSKSFLFLKVAFAWAAIAAVVVAGGASFDADLALEGQWSAGSHDPVFREVSAEPGRLPVMTLAAAEEDEEGGDEAEPAEETGEDSRRWDRLADAPKLG
jgi:hypothetical protein